MDILTNKNYGKFDYTCRYAAVPYYYNTADDKYIFGIGSNLRKDTYYTIHQVKDTDTLDELSLRYYNNPTFFWVIAYFNDIQDSFIHLSDYYTTLKIPHIASIDFGAER